MKIPVEDKSLILIAPVLQAGDRWVKQLTTGSNEILLIAPVLEAGDRCQVLFSALADNRIVLSAKAENRYYLVTPA